MLSIRDVLRNSSNCEGSNKQVAVSFPRVKPFRGLSGGPTTSHVGRREDLVWHPLPVDRHRQIDVRHVTVLISGGISTGRIRRPSSLTLALAERGEPSLGRSGAPRPA